MDRAAISEFIKVGPAYLWLDEVTHLDDQSISCRKALDPELEVFRAHYHGFPLFPGALQCEACFQASNVLLTKILPAAQGKLPVIGRVSNVKFKRLVRPKEELTIDVSIIEQQSKFIFLRGRCSVDGVTTTSLDFTATEAEVALA